MKTPALLRLALLLLLLVSSRAQAQTTPALPGYWNLETNLTTRNYTLVRFYNGQDQLVYEERLPTLCLDLSKGSVRCRRRAASRLNVALQQALRNPAGPATALVAQQFGIDRRVQRVYTVR
jgi:hypothetical protein